MPTPPDSLDHLRPGTPGSAPPAPGDVADDGHTLDADDADFAFSVSSAIDLETGEEYGLRPPPHEPSALRPAVTQPLATVEGTAAPLGDREIGDTLTSSAVVIAPGVFRPLLRLAIPVLIEQVLTMAVGLADTFLAGRFLQESHIAAIGVMAYLLWMIPCVFSLVGVGATAIIARTVGAGDIATAARVANQSLTAGAALTVGLALGMATLGPSLLVAMGLTGEAYDAGFGYLMLLTLFLPAMMVEQLGMACLRGAGDMVSGLVAMTVVNIVNVIVGVALVAGIGPIPPLGWLGLAIGTVVGYACGALMLAWLLGRGRAGLVWRWSEMAPDGPVIRRILRTGIPGGSDMLAIVGCQFLFLGMIGSLGQLALAAHALAIRLESLAYLPGTAFQVAASTTTGQYLGAGQPARAARSVWFSAALCGVFVTSMGCVFYFTPEALTGIFTNDQTADAGNQAAELLRIVALAMPFMGVGMVASGGLRGAGDVRWPLVFTFVGFLGVRIPMAAILCWDEVAVPGLGWTIPGWGLGVAGAWWAMLIDLIFRSCLTIGRFLQGSWQRQVV